jgi:osmotically inducible lipoprotein OsmB
MFKVSFTVLMFGLIGLSACTTSQEQLGGAGMGALAGAAVGGPVGAAVGGVTGVVVGPTVAAATGISHRHRHYYWANGHRYYYY